MPHSLIFHKVLYQSTQKEEKRRQICTGFSVYFHLTVTRMFLFALRVIIYTPLYLIE